MQTSVVTLKHKVMFRSQTTQTCDRNSPSNASIRKLRQSSMVCNLTKSWQTWVSESEGKQASEPFGRTPTPPCLGEAAGEPQQTWTSRMTVSLKPYPHPAQATAHASQNRFQAHPLENQKTSPCAQELSQNGSTHATRRVWPRETRSTRTEGEVEGETFAVPVVESHIKTKQVVETLSTAAQEKSASIGFLNGRISKEPLSSSEEIDKMNKQSSPTHRTKCSNVSSPTKSWKQVEKEQKPVEDDEHVEAEMSLKTEAGQRDRTSSCVETEDNGSPKEELVWMKRPSLPMYRNKDAEDANKINALSKKTHSAVGNLKSRWQNWSSEHTVNQKLNPFSEEFNHDYSMSQRLHKGQEGYGRPKEGTMTAERAKRAEQHIHREIADMCYVIRTMKDPDRDGRTRVTFRDLFDRYVRISDKVVGILLRARKHGKVAFEGEMLWQGQDDGVIITLLV